MINPDAPGPTASHTPVIRPATPQDAPALAALHVAVWRDTYGALAPAAALERLDLDHRLRGWQARLQDPAQTTWVALDADGAVAGLVTGGAAGDGVSGARPDDSVSAEIAHLYVAPEARKSGLGRALMQAAFDALEQQGHRGVGLGVVRQNYEARLFYARLAGRESGSYTDPGPLWQSLMMLVTWPLPARQPDP